MTHEAAEPTREQKHVIVNNKLNMRNWLVVSETATHLTVRYRYGSKTKELDKRVDLWENKKAPVT